MSTLYLVLLDKYYCAILYLPDLWTFMTIFLVLLYLRYRMMARGQAKVRPAQVVAHLPLWFPLLLAPKLFQGLVLSPMG